MHCQPSPAPVSLPFPPKVWDSHHLEKRGRSAPDCAQTSPPAPGSAVLLHTPTAGSGWPPCE
eukprot:40843-Chlamydomonas_euryale.AAC.3